MSLLPKINVKATVSMVVLAGFVAISYHFASEELPELSANLAANAALVAAKAISAQNSKDRPDSGPCKGEKVENEEQCRYKIIEKMQNGEVEVASKNLRERVATRDKPDLRTAVVWSQVLDKVHQEKVNIDIGDLEKTASLLAASVPDINCQKQIEISLIEYFLKQENREQAEKILRALPDSVGKSESPCMRGSKNSIAIYKSSILREPFDRVSLGSGQMDIWLSASMSLVYLARTPYNDVKDKVIEIALDNKGSFEEKIALDILGRSIKNSDRVLSEKLLARAEKL